MAVWMNDTVKGHAVGGYRGPNDATAAEPWTGPGLGGVHCESLQAARVEAL